MVEYDLSIHLPSQVENYLQNVNDLEDFKIDNSIEIIKSLLQNDKFNQGLADYRKTLEIAINQLDKDTVAKIKNEEGSNSIQDIMEEINKVINKTEKLNLDYRRTVQNYILGFISSLKEFD